MSIDLGPRHVACLRAIETLVGDDDDRAALTSAVAQAMYDFDVESTGSGQFFRQPPWHGLRDLVDDLECEGLVEVDPGMASFVPHGAPTPIQQDYFLSLTARGREVLRKS